MTALAIAGLTAIVTALSLVRVFAGPTLYDRMLAGSATLVKTSVLMAAFAALERNPGLADAALGALLAGFVFNLAMLKLYRTKSLQPPLAQLGERL